MDIRPASAADVVAIAAVPRLSRADYYGASADETDGREEMWEHLLAETGRVTFVADSSGRVGAFMSARRLSDPEAVFELTAIYVHPAHFGQGMIAALPAVRERAR